MASTADHNRQHVLKKALIEIKELRARLAEAERTRNEPIAMIGMGCRFPAGANNPDLFWQLLNDGQDGITEVPEDRWDLDAYFDPDPDAAGKMYTRWSGFLDGPADRFDAEFFGISPREATSMDPQQRLLLEVSWEALEYASQPADKLLGSNTGVFVGISTNDYAQRTMFADPRQIDVYTATGNALNCAAGRLAFFFGMQGPTIAVDTACSSSLVAVHLGCQSLRNQECRMALAGGVSLILSPNGTIATSRARMMSSDGRCKTFDASADGYVRGEGCGMVVLKRLSDALHDGDPVAAVIRGSAVNQDGKSSGLTVPNGVAQQTLLREALKSAGLDPQHISYLEAHGTGTALGDPIEMDSIRAVFTPGCPPDYRCAIGSVKTNIGHLEAAAGIAGLIKVVLAMQHQTVPPHLHLNQLNPHIELEGTPIHIPTERTAWPRAAEPRRAGVSSFGFSGTNSHVIVEEAPQQIDPEPRLDSLPSRPLHLLTVSARSAEALDELAERYRQFVLANPETSLADIAFTANAGRSHFKHRAALVADSPQQLVEQLARPARVETGAETGANDKAAGAERAKVAFLFSGQGAQYAGMGRELYQTQPAFRRCLDQCDQLLQPHLEHALLDVLFGEGQQAALLDQTAYTQPALFALEYALAQLWLDWGIEPAVVMGHSVGEYVAACLADVFSLEDGLRLIATRARLMQSLPDDGAMAVVLADPTTVADAIEPVRDQVAIAAVNGPQNVTISGLRATVQKLAQRFQDRQVTVKWLNVSHAFHSPLMEPILDQFTEAARQITYQPPQRRLISNLTGSQAGPEVANAEYWRRHLRESVQFLDGIKTAGERGCQVYLEVGPGTTLLGMGQRALDKSPQPPNVAWLPSLRKQRGEWQQILQTLAKLYLNQADVDWNAFDREYQRKRVVLPNYPFQRKKFWIEDSSLGTGNSTEALQRTDHPFLQRAFLSPSDELRFESRFDASSLPIVNDHRIHSLAWVNLVVYLEMALAAAHRWQSDRHYYLKDVAIPHGLVLPDDDTRTVQCILTPNSDGEAVFRIFSLQTDGTGEKPKGGLNWTLHARGTIVADGSGEIPPPNERVDLEQVRQRCHAELSDREFYDLLRSHGAQLGPTCRLVERVWRRDGEAIARLTATTDQQRPCRLHLGAIDSSFQLFGVALPQEAPKDYLLSGLGSFRYFGTAGHGPLWCHTVMVNQDDETHTVTGDVHLVDAAGTVVAEALDVHLQRMSRDPELSDLAQRPAGLAARAHRDEILMAAPEDRFALVASYLIDELSHATGHAAAELNRTQPITGQVDSLIAVELKTRITADLNVDLPVAVFYDGKSLDDVTELLLAQLQPTEHLLSAFDDTDIEAVHGLLAELENLSDEEAEALLISEKQQIEEDAGVE